MLTGAKVRALGTTVSGRTLTQLPEKSVIQYLGDGEDCSLDMALEFILRSIEVDKKRAGLKRTFSNMS
jgi:hypothetical protein